MREPYAAKAFAESLELLGGQGSAVEVARHLDRNIQSVRYWARKALQDGLIEQCGLDPANGVGGRPAVVYRLKRK